MCKANIDTQKTHTLTQECFCPTHANPGVFLSYLTITFTSLYSRSVGCKWLKHESKSQRCSVGLEGVQTLKSTAVISGLYDFTSGLFKASSWPRSPCGAALKERRHFEERRWGISRGRGRPLCFLPVFIAMCMLGMGRRSRRVADPCFPPDPVQFLTGCHVKSPQDHSHASGLKRDRCPLAAWLAAWLPAWLAAVSTPSREGEKGLWALRHVCWQDI